jgi:hypothetical protein
MNEDEEEIEHFLDVLAAYVQYDRISSILFQRHKTSFNSIPESHRLILPDFEPRSDQLLACMATNARFLNKIVLQSHIFENEETPAANYQQ